MTDYYPLFLWCVFLIGVGLIGWDSVLLIAHFVKRRQAREKQSSRPSQAGTSNQRIGIEQDGGSLNVDGAEISDQTTGLLLRKCKAVVKKMTVT